MNALRMPSWMLTACMALLLHPEPAESGAPVRVWEEQVTMPTYPIGPSDPYPVFAALGGRRIYPYPMQTNLSSDRRDETYRVIFLENEHLKVMVLPDVGGRMYSLYDKNFEHEVFYRNNVFKPGLVGLRGAWISGGIEWNFPQGHTVTTVSPVLSDYRRHPDGSASITVGNLEKVSRMFWSVTLTLHPGVAAMQEDVRLYNRTTLPHRHYYWANTAFPATPGTRFISPAKYQTDHGGSRIFDWPEHDGVDISWDKNNFHAMSYFGLEVPSDFFGAYDYDSNTGLAHVADHRAVAGKKFWTWGNDDAGRRWIDILTDADGQYVEVQSGRFWNQSTWRPLMPQQVVRWTEWWYPVSGINGFNYATENGALNIGADGDRLRVGISPTRVWGAGRLEVERDGRVIAAADIDLHPAAPVGCRLPPDRVAGAHAGRVSLSARNARRLARGAPAQFRRRGRAVLCRGHPGQT